MLLNVDKPWKSAVYHPLGTLCGWVPKPYGTDLKPVGRLGRDGGWFRVSTMAEAASTLQREAPHLGARLCSNCWRRMVKLHRSGAISDDEFAEQKRRLLAQ